MRIDRLKEPRKTTQKGAATRQRLLDAALASFRTKGFDATTMRDIARAVGISAGATYHYFASKEALVQAYYETALKRDEDRAAETLERTSAPRERLAAILHSKIDGIAPDKDMLSGLFRRASDPRDPLSVFSTETQGERARSIAIFRKAIYADTYPAEAAEVVPLALWALELAMIMYMLADRSEGHAMTHTLIDGALDTVMPLILLAKQPKLLTPMLRNLKQLLAQTELLPVAPRLPKPEPEVKE